MKEFCECNSEWMWHNLPYSRDDAHVSLNKPCSVCNVCNVIKWYDPHYENEQWDKKQSDKGIDEMEIHKIEKVLNVWDVLEGAKLSVVKGQCEYIYIFTSSPDDIKYFGEVDLTLHKDMARLLAKAILEFTGE